MHMRILYIIVCISLHIAFIDQCDKTHLATFTNLQSYTILLVSIHSTCYIHRRPTYKRLGGKAGWADPTCPAPGQKVALQPSQDTAFKSVHLGWLSCLRVTRERVRLSRPGMLFPAHMTGTNSMESRNFGTPGGLMYTWD